MEQLRAQVDLVLAEVRSVGIKQDELHKDFQELSERVVRIEAVDESVDGPNRAVLDDMKSRMAVLEERQSKATTGAVVGGGSGVIALVIEGLVRLWEYWGVR